MTDHEERTLRLLQHCIIVGGYTKDMADPLERSDPNDVPWPTDMGTSGLKSPAELNVLEPPPPSTPSRSSTLVKKAAGMRQVRRPRAASYISRGEMDASYSEVMLTTPALGAVLQSNNDTPQSSPSNAPPTADESDGFQVVVSKRAASKTPRTQRYAAPGTIDGSFKAVRACVELGGSFS